MTGFFLKIHDYLAQHRIFSVAVLLVLLVVAVLLSLRLRFQENVADQVKDFRIEQHKGTIFEEVAKQRTGLLRKDCPFFDV